MYNGYRSFLKRKLKISISKLDRVLILIYCETRQELLSRYIALEMLRQKQVDTNNKSNVIDTLEIARDKFPGSQISLDALCKRYNIAEQKRGLLKILQLFF